MATKKLQMRQLKTKELAEIITALQQKGATITDIYQKYGALLLGVTAEEYDELYVSETAAVQTHITESIKLFS